MGSTICEIQTDLSMEDVKRITDAGIVGVDCEMGGLNPNRDLLYLVQMADPNGTTNIIKTSSWHQAGNLKNILSSRNITKVFHFAIVDSAFLSRNLAVTIENVFCTKIASKLARTYSNSHGLGSLLEELMGLEKDKKMQTSYWGGEITDEQIQYAVKDVRYLVEIKRKLENILVEKGTLPTGITYVELNKQCQRFIPTLMQLWLNGWGFGVEDPETIFGR